MRALTFAVATATGYAIAWSSLAIADRLTWTARTRRLTHEIEYYLATVEATR